MDRTVTAIAHTKKHTIRAHSGRFLDRTHWGEPLGWHKLFGHSFRFHRGILASPSRRRGLGKGTAFEFLSPVVLSKSSRCSLGSQKTPSLRFAIRPELTPRSVARTLREVDSPAPSASAADCNTAR